MDGIKRLLSDPTWWFTAVIVGILASLFASYIRDAVSWLASRAFKLSRKRRDRRLAMEARRIDFLAGHPDLLILEMGKLILEVLYFALIAGLSISILMFLTLSQKISAPNVSLWDNKFFGYGASGVFGLLSGFLGALISFRLRIVSRARRKYEGQRRAELAHAAATAPRDKPDTR
jgi:hypothetical protein